MCFSDDRNVAEKKKLHEKHSVHFAADDDVTIIEGTFDIPNDTTKHMLDVETLWRIEPSNYLVSRLGCFKITDTSIGYLKSSLSDEVYF